MRYTCPMGVTELFFSLPTREVMQAIWAVLYSRGEKASSLALCVSMSCLSSAFEPDGSGRGTVRGGSRRDTGGGEGAVYT